MIHFHKVALLYYSGDVDMFSTYVYNFSFCL